MYRTVRSRFGAVYVFPVRGSWNVLVVAAREADALSTAELVQRGRQLDRTLHFEPSLATLASWRRQVELDMSKIPVLSDEFAPVDRLIQLGARSRPPAPRR